MLMVCCCEKIVNDPERRNRRKTKQIFFVVIMPALKLSAMPPGQHTHKAQTNLHNSQNFHKLVYIASTDPYR